MSRGIVIVAVGEKGSKSDYSLYGRLAFNLAMSIKTNTPTAKITLLYTNAAIESLRDVHLAWFDSFIEIPQEYYKQNEINHYHKVKFWAYALSPYDKTMYIDADALWLPYMNGSAFVNARDINKLFDRLAGIPFTGCMGRYYDVLKKTTIGNKYMWWLRKGATLDDLCKHHNITSGFIPAIQSSFMYFEKGEVAAKIFADAKRLYEEDDTLCGHWANGKPDEYFFNVAYAYSGLVPDINIFPVYIEFVEGKIINIKKIVEAWDIYSNCGANSSASIKQTYNYIVEYYCKKNNVLERFFHQDKGKLITERKNG